MRNVFPGRSDTYELQLLEVAVELQVAAVELLEAEVAAAALQREVVVEAAAPVPRQLRDWTAL